ncbi:M16 family metallopeptidase [Salinimicrobium sp. GXAS 041]|uniref:M16 family metallopeptidase n=1 Tax=Salinimicrobium sp. GXAS 041 TaxID=3400806 RepID=UPI003C7814D3
MAQANVVNNDSIPLDPSIRHGRLDNGFTYYIKALPGAQDGTKMRLVHKVGSNDEKENEGDFAHAIEHLAFKATKVFPLGLENSKRFNTSDSEIFKLNASSGRRSTTYEFDIQNTSTEGFRLGLLWFREIAQNLLLSKKDIESVRGEVREEFLGKVGATLNSSIANSKMYSGIFPCEPDEEGLLEHYNYFIPEEVRKFYDTWYNSKYLSLVIVGDINDPADLERQIKSLFSKLPSNDPSVEPVNCDSLYFKSPPQFVVVQREIDRDKLIADKSAEMHLIFRFPKFRHRFKTVGDATQNFYLKMMIKVLGERLRQETKGYGMDQPMLYDLYSQELPSAMEITFSIEDGAGKKTTEKILKVYHQFQTYGVLQSEFNKVKEKLVSNVNWFKEDQPQYWLKEMNDHIMRGQELPEHKKEEMLKSLKATKLSDLNTFIKDQLLKGPEDIGIVAPAEHEALGYQEEEVRSWIMNSLNQPVEPFKEPNVKNFLSEEEVEGLDSAVILTSGTDESGAREFVLNNGVKLVLLPDRSTDTISQNSINLHGFRIGGTELLPEDEYWSALNAPEIVANSGVNELDKFEVNDILKKHGHLPGAVVPYIDYAEHGIYGRSYFENVETMLQLVYLFFKKPNMDELAYEDWKRKRIDWYLDSSGDVYATDFNNARRTVTGDRNLQSSHNRKTLPDGTLNYMSLERTDYKKAHDIYRRFFGDAEGFIFLITGAFEIEELLPLVQKYLGNLPGGKPCIERQENGSLMFPEGPSFQELPNTGNLDMLNISYGTSFIIKPENIYDWKERLKIEVLGEVVRQKLWGLRFKKGYGLYDVSARGLYNFPLQRYEVRTYLFCQPQDFQRLQEEIKQIYSEIRAGKISEEELSRALELVDLFNFSERAMRLGTKIKELYHHYRFDYPWVGLPQMRELTSEVDREDLIEVANKYLKKENFHEFVMYGK